MRDTVTISIPREIKKQIDRIVDEEGISRSEIFRASLTRYVAMKRYRALREKGLKKAAARGIFTDEDVFKIVS